VQITIIPVRIHTNLKAETLDDFVRKKKGLHTSAFRFRIEELRVNLLQLALNSSRVHDPGFKRDSLDSLIESIVDKARLRLLFTRFLITWCFIG
jgi:hypothetical protein